MTCRALRASDATAACALYKELVGDIAVADAQRFAEVVAHPGTTVFGAEENGAVVAIATVHVLPNMTFGGRPYALIENVVTASSMQGRGHGRAVMETAVAHAWQQGCYKIMLLTGRTARARGFYEALGFTADEKWGMTLRRAGPRRPAAQTPPS